MDDRVLGRTGRKVSVVGLGTWQLGADWGAVREEDAFAVLDAAVAGGVDFFDTADVYGDGRSEQLIGRYLGYYVSTIPLMLGFLWVAFDARKQGWHDKMANTVVIRKRA